MRCMTHGNHIASIGVDTWGVDFALLGQTTNCWAIRIHDPDPHTHGITSAAFEHVPRAEIFAESGLQFLEFNTLFQLWALCLANLPLLESAR